MGLAFLADEQLAKSALHMWETHRTAVEAHVETVVLPPLEAELARVAGEARVHRDPVADRYAARLGPDGRDDAGDLMAEHHRLAQPHDSEAAVIVIMQVRTADAAGADAHERLCVADLGRGPFLDPQILRGVSDDRAHRRFPSFRPPDLNEFAMTPICRSSAVLCRERPSRCS